MRTLYARLEGKNVDLIRDEVRGAVMRAYAANDTARVEGIVLELHHRRADGIEVSFHVSIKDWKAGSGEMKVDYTIRRGERVDTYAVKDGRAHLVKSENIEAERCRLRSDRLHKTLP